jgi:hypothetical protein
LIRRAIDPPINRAARINHVNPGITEQSGH